MTDISDNVKARLLGSDGVYRRLSPEEGQPEVVAQETFIALAVQG